MTMQTAKSHFIEVNGQRLHYLSTSETNSQEITLLLHGWPTSSYLWRNVMTQLDIGETVIALDLPGFGKSDKPLEGDAYSLDFYQSIIEDFIDVLGVTTVNLVVHDLGGPVGLYWAVNNLDRVRRFVLLNTLVYPEFHWFVKLFVACSFMPGVRYWMSSQQAIKLAMNLGTTTKLSKETIGEYQSAFITKNDRRALIKTLQKANPKKLAVIASRLKHISQPVQVIYGEKDLALPDVAKTMEKVQRDIPHSTVYRLAGCGHFLQEDEPTEISKLMTDFLNN